MKRIMRKQMDVIYSNQGQGVLGLLLLSTLGVIAVYTLTQSLVNQQKAERGIASNLDLHELSNLVHLMTDSTNTCAMSGLVGVDVTPLLIDPNGVVPVTLRLTNAIGTPGGPAISADASLGLAAIQHGIRKIDGLNLVAIAAASGVGGSSYLATLELVTSIRGSAITMRSPVRRFPLSVTLDGTNKIATCGAVPAVTGGAVPATPVPAEIVYKTGVLVADNNSSCEAPDGGTEDWLTYGKTYNGTAVCDPGYVLSAGGVNCDIGGYMCSWHNKIHPRANVLNSYPDPANNRWVAQCCIRGSLGASNLVHAICVRQ